MKPRRIDFYPADWLEGTMELDWEQRGAYITICALIYARGGPITVELLKRASPGVHGHTINWALKSLEKSLKLTRNESELDVKRCRNELERATKRSRNAAENAAKRWNNNTLPDATDNAPAYAKKSSPRRPARDNHQSTIESPSLNSESPFRAIGDLATPPLAPSPARRNGAHSLAAATAGGQSSGSHLNVDDQVWELRLSGFKDPALPFWHGFWGPMPTEPNTYVPSHLLAKHGFR